MKINLFYSYLKVDDPAVRKQLHMKTQHGLSFFNSSLIGLPLNISQSIWTAVECRLHYARLQG